MLWVHFKKICSSSAQGEHLSAETYKILKDINNFDCLQDWCDEWADNVNNDHEIGHGGYGEYIVVDQPPKEWIEKQLIYEKNKISNSVRMINILEKLL